LIDPGVCVSCRDDDDCSATRVCEDYECVVPKPTGDGGKSGSGGKAGSGGKPGTAGSGGKSGAGGSGGGAVAGTGVGGTLTAGSGGVAGAAGAAGAGGSAAGEGGAGGSEDCGCTADQTCTPDERCVPPTLIDDLWDCDDQILAIAGRKGNWSAYADVGIDFDHGFGDPGAGWTEHTCAAWAMGSELTIDDPNATLAFLGFRLNVDELDDGLAYDLSQYNGIQIQLETMSAIPTSLQVVVKTTGGGIFQVTLSPVDGALYARSAHFVSMTATVDSAEPTLDASTISEVNFAAADASAFAFAIHQVSLF